MITGQIDTCITLKGHFLNKVNIPSGNLSEEMKKMLKKLKGLNVFILKRCMEFIEI